MELALNVRFYLELSLNMSRAYDGFLARTALHSTRMAHMNEDPLCDMLWRSWIVVYEGGRVGLTSKLSQSARYRSNDP